MLEILCLLILGAHGTEKQINNVLIFRNHKNSDPEGLQFIPTGQHIFIFVIILRLDRWASEKEWENVHIYSYIRLSEKKVVIANNK